MTRRTVFVGSSLAADRERSERKPVGGRVDSAGGAALPSGPGDELSAEAEVDRDDLHPAVRAELARLERIAGR